MSRLLLFLFGILLGAAGVLWALDRGWLPGTLVDGASRRQSPDSTALPLPPPNKTTAPATRQATRPVPIDGAGERSPVGDAVDDAIASLPMPPLAPSVSTPDFPALPPPAPNLPGLLVPVQGYNASQLVDTFTQGRGEGRLHDAIDIMAPRGTPVLAVDDGTIAKLFASKPGGLTIYQFDSQSKVAYYYAHLESYAPNLVEGMSVRRGEVIGYVGSTGNANPAAPHLHFAVFLLGPEKNWWKGTALNPYPLLGGGG